MKPYDWCDPRCPNPCYCQDTIQENMKESKMTTMTDNTHKDVWSFTENAPDYCSDVADLWHWSTNYDAGKGPFMLFVDMIGWSEDNIGETLYDLKSASLGYLELDKLADALKQYTARPQDVRSWVDELLQYDES